MSPQEQPRFTIKDLAELTRREQAARGDDPAQIDRNLMARLEVLRASQGPEPVRMAEITPRIEGPGIESRLTALEAEVKWLRERIEGNNG